MVGVGNLPGRQRAKDAPEVVVVEALDELVRRDRHVLVSDGVGHHAVPVVDRGLRGVEATEHLVDGGALLVDVDRVRDLHE